MNSSNITRLWFANQSLNQIVTIAANIFVGFYIWETTSDINKILEFNLGLFLLLPVGVLLSGLFAEYTSLKASFAASKILHVCYLTLLLTLGESLFSSVFTFGLLSGLITGLVLAPEEVVIAKIPQDDRNRLRGKLNALQRFFSIITPLGLAFLIDKSGASFQIPFILAGLLVTFLLIFGLLVDFPALDNRFSLATIFSFPGGNPEKNFLATSSFLNGIKEGIHYSLIGILTLSFAGSLINWSYINVSFALVAILLALIYNRFSFVSRPILSLGLGAVIFLAGSAYFAYDFSFAGILVYLAGLTLFDVFFGFGFNATTTKLTALDVNTDKDLDNEYTFFIYLFQAMGMVIPIAILYYLQIDLNDPLFFRVLLVAVSLIPFTILSKLKNSFYLTHQTQ